MCGWYGAGNVVGWFGGKRGKVHGGEEEGGRQVKAEVITGRRTVPVFPSAPARPRGGTGELLVVNSNMRNATTEQVPLPYSTPDQKYSYQSSFSSPH